MSAPHDNHSDSKYPEDKVSHYPRDKSKKKPEGIMGKMDKITHMAKRLKGLQETNHFGAKHGARHKRAQQKARGESPF